MFFLSINNVSEILGMQFLIAEQSLTLSFPLEAEYDLSDFNSHCDQLPTILNLLHLHI